MSIPTAAGLEHAVRQALDAAGDEAWGTDAMDAWLSDAVVHHVSSRRIPPSHIRIPRPGLLKAVRQGVRVHQGTTDRVLQEMCATLLARGLCWQRRDFVHLSQAALLARLTADEAHILLAFARRNFAPIVMHVDLRYESLRNGLPVRHRAQLLDHGLAKLVTLSRPAMMGAYVANLERLKLIVAGHLDVSPAEDPEHIRARAARGKPRVPMQTQFRRWLAGRDVHASDAEGSLLLRPPAGKVGGIQVSARTLIVSRDGRALLHVAATRELAASSRPQPG